MEPVRLPRGLELVRTLGVGGFGYVVHARDPNIGRDVAVKLVYGGGYVDDAVARMLREGTALSRLRHPAVVHVYEAVRVGSDVALLMELVPGGDLTSRLNRADFTVTDRLAVLAQVADGLAAAHSAGIVHRDLKPANILVAETPAGPQAKIADFGLARLGRDAAAFRTAAGIAAFTPGYGAPEQMVDPDHETPAIDWYSFAVVAFRLLRGELPLPGVRDGAGAEIFARALSLDPAERLAPSELVGLLRAVPEEEWTPVVGAGYGDVPADSSPTHDPQGAPAAAPARSAAPVTVRTSPAPGAPPPPVDVDDGTGWLAVPVYHPPARRPSLWRRRSAPVVALLGCIVGLVLGLVAALVVLALR